MTGRELVQALIAGGDLDRDVMVEDTRTGNEIDLQACDYNYRSRQYQLTVATEPDEEE